MKAFSSADAARLAPWATAVAIFVFPAVGITSWTDPSHWLALFLIWVFAQAALAPERFSRFVPAATPCALGGIRAWTCLIMLSYVLTSDLARTARLPREMLVSMGLMSMLHRLPIAFGDFLASEAALRAFELFTIVALVLGAIGLFTRVTVPLAALSTLVYIGVFWHYAYFYHQCMMGIYVLCALSLTPCGDGFSVDAWLARSRGRPVAPNEPAMVYGWSRYLCWIALAMPYQLAGLSKLHSGGFFWWDPANLRGKIYGGMFEPGPLDESWASATLGAPDFFFAAIGLTTILFEITFAATLFSAHARRFLPICAAGMHLGILTLQNFIFLDAFLLQAILWRDGALINRITSIRATSASDQFKRKPNPSYYSMVVFDAALVFILGWIWTLEFYPVSTWKMFAGRGQGTVAVYHKVWADQASGARAPAPYEDCFPAPSYNPFVRMPRYAFDERRTTISRQFFEACAAELNREVAPDARTQAFEIEQWRWDFGENPNPPPYGEIVAKRTFRLPE